MASSRAPWGQGDRIFEVNDGVEVKRGRWQVEDRKGKGRSKGLITCSWTLSHPIPSTVTHVLTLRIGGVWRKRYFCISHIPPRLNAK